MHQYDKILSYIDYFSRLEKGMGDIKKDYGWGAYRNLHQQGTNSIA